MSSVEENKPKKRGRKPKSEKIIEETKLDKDVSKPIKSSKSTKILKNKELEVSEEKLKNTIETKVTESINPEGEKVTEKKKRGRKPKSEKLNSIDKIINDNEKTNIKNKNEEIEFQPLVKKTTTKKKSALKKEVVEMNDSEDSNNSKDDDNDNSDINNVNFINKYENVYNNENKSFEQLKLKLLEILQTIETRKNENILLEKEAEEIVSKLYQQSEFNIINKSKEDDEWYDKIKQNLKINQPDVIENSDSNDDSDDSELSS